MYLTSEESQLCCSVTCELDLTVAVIIFQPAFFIAFALQVSIPFNESFLVNRMLENPSE